MVSLLRFSCLVINYSAAGFLPEAQGAREREGRARAQKRGERERGKGGGGGN